MSGRANTTMPPNPDAEGCPFEEQGFPAAYAFDALDGEDLARFRVHLPTCRICDAALREFRETTAQFPLLIDPDTAPQPSPALRARLLDAVAADLAAERAAAPAPTPIPFPIRRRLPQAYAVVAVLLLALALGQLGWILNLQRDINQAVKERDQAQQSLAVTRWQLAAAQAGQQITGEVVYLRDQQRAVLVVNGLPQLQPGQVYQIWLIKQGGPPVPETVFLTDTTGVQANFDEFQTLAITIEPGPRGSLAPTTPILVVGSLTQ